MNPLRGLIADRIRATGPISLAEYMGLSLYHPSLGYYARASRRTGRTGDFFTSVDVGPVFGELLARQFAEMWRILQEQPAAGGRRPVDFDLVEAGAGSGRLARDILDAAASHHRDFYDIVRLHLVEIAPAARAAQRDTLGPHVSKLASSSESVPDSVCGVMFANELLDALPTHAVVMREDGLREIFVDLQGDELIERELEPSTPQIARQLAQAGGRLEPGWRAEINLEATAWIRRAARSLSRGFLLVMDYGHEAQELYSVTHSAGTLMTFHQHTSDERESLLRDPGERDMTAHVDLTTMARTAEGEGLLTLGRLDQTYFLLGLGLAEMLDAPQFDRASLKRRLALKTLMLPGGLGSTLKVLIFGKEVGRPALKGLSYRIRLT